MLNPNPQQIKAPWFLSGEFFDPNDMVQAKYEMLRHVQVDGVSKVEAAALFGMSRPTFYPLPRDHNAMVRLLANFLLHTYSEHTHVC